MLYFFARRHRLTRMEEQVLDFLSRGYSAPEISTELNLSVTTIRTHIRSACQKTSTNGARALLEHVARLPPIEGLPARHGTS